MNRTWNDSAVVKDLLGKEPPEGRPANDEVGLGREGRTHVSHRGLCAGRCCHSYLAVRVDRIVLGFNLESNRAQQIYMCLASKR